MPKLDTSELILDVEFEGGEHVVQDGTSMWFTAWEKEGDFVGQVGMQFSGRSDGEGLEVEPNAFFVREDYRGLGVGKGLVKLATRLLAGNEDITVLRTGIGNERTLMALHQIAQENGAENLMTIQNITIEPPVAIGFGEAMDMLRERRLLGKSITEREGDDHLMGTGLIGVEIDIAASRQHIA